MARRLLVMRAPPARFALASLLGLGALPASLLAAGAAEAQELKLTPKAAPDASERAALHEKRARDAVQGYYDALIKAQPNNPYFHEMKGEILIKAGRPADAAKSFATALRCWWSRTKA